jgi:SAM-dependent methyltransferase
MKLIPTTLSQPVAMYLEQHLPPDRYRRLLQQIRRVVQPARLGTLRRTTPLSASWGADRGSPIDRYYIEQFLAEHRGDICGHVLELRDSRYTDAYGSNVIHHEVLDIDPANRRATIIADLSAADAISDNRFDCFLLTQTLHFIYDYRAAVAHAQRILRPGGVLLATVPSISRVDRRLDADYWRFTVAACTVLFGELFSPENVQVRSYGNVLAAIAFLAGMAHQELSAAELSAHDQHFPVIIAIRAVKCR